MSAPYRHICGTRLTGRVEPDGWQYRMVFRSAETEQPVSICPRCGADLAEALRTGELIETTHQPTTHP